MCRATTATIRAVLVSAILVCLAACASTSTTTDPKIKPRQTLECPYGMMLICESHQNEPSRGGDEEIPEYDRCRCEINPV